MVRPVLVTRRASQAPHHPFTRAHGFVMVTRGRDPGAFSPRARTGAIQSGTGPVHSLERAPPPPRAGEKNDHGPRASWREERGLFGSRTAPDPQPPRPSRLSVLSDGLAIAFGARQLPRPCAHSCWLVVSSSLVRWWSAAVLLRRRARRPAVAAAATRAEPVRPVRPISSAALPRSPARPADRASPASRRSARAAQPRVAAVARPAAARAVDRREAARVVAA